MEVTREQYRAIKQAVKEVLASENYTLANYDVNIRISKENPYLQMRLIPKAPEVVSVVNRDEDESPAAVTVPTEPTTPGNSNKDK